MRPGPFVLLLLALPAGGAGAVAAQIPTDTARVDTARADTTVRDTTPADTTEARVARPRYEAPRVAFSVLVGTLGFGDLHHQRVRTERLGRDGAVLDEGSLRRTLSAGGGLQVSASALLGLTPAWAVRAGVSVGEATLEDGYAGEEALREDAGQLEVAASSDLSVVSVEAALRFRMRSGRRVQPYAELGLAAVRVEAEDRAFPGAAALDGDASLAGVAALGAVVPIRGAFAGRIQVSTHLFRTPARLAAAGEAVAEGSRLRVTFDEPAAGPFADPMPELTRTLRLDLGLAIELGSVSRRRGAAAVRTTAPPP